MVRIQQKHISKRIQKLRAQCPVPPQAFHQNPSKSVEILGGTPGKMHRNLWKSIDILGGTPYKMHKNLSKSIEILGVSLTKMQESQATSWKSYGGYPLQNASESMEAH